MTMVIALLMGTVLLAGTSGLMVRQIMARKLGASESYQQMAESAALNGLNRIISDINRDDRNNYTGFLLSLNNSEGQWGWAKPNTDDYELVELCTPVTKYTKAYPAQTALQFGPLSHRQMITTALVGNSNPFRTLPMPLHQLKTRE